MKTQSHRFPFAFQRVIGQTPTDRGRERTCAAKVPSYQLVSAQQRASEITFTRDTWIGCAHQGLACVHTSSLTGAPARSGLLCTHARLAPSTRRQRPSACICHTGADLSRGATKSRDPLPPELRQSCGRAAAARTAPDDLAVTISSRSRRDLAATISPRRSHHHRAHELAAHEIATVMCIKKCSQKLRSSSFLGTSS